VNHPPIQWRISSFSANGGSCVAVAAVDDAVLVRNSNHPDRGTLALPARAMMSFVAACAAGELDDLG
jgi:hypothetical protein